jgi:hypothetical protein
MLKRTGDSLIPVAPRRFEMGFANRPSKAPNSNFQAPEKHQEPSSKAARTPEEPETTRIPASDWMLGNPVWKLKFGASLELGAWRLELLR